MYPFTPAHTGYKVGDWVKVRIKSRLATNIGRGEVVCIDKVQDDCLRFVNLNLNPALVLWARQEFLHPHEVCPCDPPVVKAAETFPGVKTEVTVSETAISLANTPPGVDLDDELPECCTCFGDGYVEDEFGLIKFCQCETEPKLSQKKTQRAIAPVVENDVEEESDQNPILTGLTFSDRFLARYSPPQPENIHYKADVDGQLNILDFEVSSDEPPDPDDFESLDAFREAIALWDAQNPEPFAASIDSMREWAPCPEEWYEPKAEILPLKASSMIELPEQSEVLELFQVGESFDTLDFAIPTFDRLGDRPNSSDEPPDTGIFARLPKPKPPTFPPQAASWTQVSGQPKSARVSLSQPKSVHPETLPKLFHRVAAGSSTQPARSPPGGDA